MIVTYNKPFPSVVKSHSQVDLLKSLVVCRANFEELQTFQNPINWFFWL
jgi:hypothetical protein